MGRRSFFDFSFPYISLNSDLHRILMFTLFDRVYSTVRAFRKREPSRTSLVKESMIVLAEMRQHLLLFYLVFLWPVGI